MRRLVALLAVLGTVAIAGCVENTAPGNDREAELEPPGQPAPLASAAEATTGVAANMLIPETMTEQDRTNLPRIDNRCFFRMTRVGFPVLAYGSIAVIKVNGKLVTLQPQGGQGEYASGGIQVSVRPLEEPSGEELFPAEMVRRVEGAPDELGYHGFAGC